MNSARAYWMYDNRIKNNRVQSSFLKGVQGFITAAMEHPCCVKKGFIKCPCSSETCRNKKYLSPTTVSEHLRRNGFMHEYYVWTSHGEEGPSEAYLQWREKKGLGPLHDFIECCRNMCMTYDGDDVDLMECKYCGLKRYDYYT